ncbi:MAG: hypothetical protein PHQ00_07775 [Phycisphaerae bacterium]|nr:hypothetical protein [Phycisphaerae bacterium]
MCETKKLFLIVGDTVGWTELPKGGESAASENSQVLFNGEASGPDDALQQCRNAWKDYDLKGEPLTIYEIASKTDAEF